MRFFRRLDELAKRSNRPLAAVAFGLALLVFYLGLAKIDSLYPGLLTAGLAVASGSID